MTGRVCPGRCKNLFRCSLLWSSTFPIDMLGVWGWLILLYCAFVHTGNVIMSSCGRDERWLVCRTCCRFMVDLLIYYLSSSLLKSYFCVSLLMGCSTFETRIPTSPCKELSNLLSITIFVAKSICRVDCLSSPIKSVVSSYCNRRFVMYSSMY